MTNNLAGDSSDQDWRLQAELDVADTHHALGHLIGRLRGPDPVKDIEGAVASDVVITHDGTLVFAYAASEIAITAARRAIESALARDAIAASIRVSRWDDANEQWQQTDPPLDQAEHDAAEAAERAGDVIETRTMVATAGKLVRAEYEETMLSWAGRLGLECKVIEHPHLLTTQIGFTLTGPRKEIEEFSRGLVAEGWTMVRTEETISFGI
jgi:hypothetical protein